MPFTFSHPAAVLPLRYLAKHWLSLTGLVVGSMVPDFEYFIRMKIESKYSHTLAGLFWFDLPLGLLLMLIYNAFVKDSLIDHLPTALNRRFSDFKTASKPKLKYYLPIVVISILIGAATHIFWDGFTHPDGCFVLSIHKLRHHIFVAGHSFQLYNILQQISSFIGALVILAVILRLPLHQKTRATNIFYYWLLVFAIALIVVTIRMLTGLSWARYGDVIVTSISGLLIGLLITSILIRERVA